MPNVILLDSTWRVDDAEVVGRCQHECAELEDAHSCYPVASHCSSVRVLAQLDPGSRNANAAHTKDGSTVILLTPSAVRNGPTLVKRMHSDGKS